jgi:hypothetical protein
MNRPLISSDARHAAINGRAVAAVRQPHIIHRVLCSDPMHQQLLQQTARARVHKSIARCSWSMSRRRHGNAALAINICTYLNHLNAQTSTAATAVHLCALWGVDYVQSLHLWHRACSKERAPQPSRTQHCVPWPAAGCWRHHMPYRLAAVMPPPPPRPLLPLRS